MRKVIVSVYSTLNGIISPLDWSFSDSSEERGKYARDLLFESDALLMGRETYEVFASAWPSRTAADDGPGEAGFIDRINTMRKYVASTTLQEPLTWHNSVLLKGDLATEVTKLKQQPGQAILIYGAGPVAHTLIWSWTSVQQRFVGSCSGYQKHTDRVAPEFLEAARKYLGQEQGTEFEADARTIHKQMARIEIEPQWLHRK